MVWPTPDWTSECDPFSFYYDGTKGYIYHRAFENPHPERPVAGLVIGDGEGGFTAMLVAAITLASACSTGSECSSGECIYGSCFHAP